MWVLAAGLMVSVAGCGGGQAVPHEGAGPVSGAREGGLGTGPGTVLDAEALRKALPDLQSMPVGWKTGITQLNARDVPREKRCPKEGGPKDCWLQWSHGTVQYRAPGDSGSVDWYLSAYPDREVAGTAFKNRHGNKPSAASEVSMPKVGDESLAYAKPRAAYADPSIAMTVRVGTVIAVLTYQDSEKNPDSAQVLLSLAQMQAKRLRQAELGRVPTATAG
ncbi:hypothetical protein FGW37_04420 [Streptomyces rectiverticillatus]|uniref:hypothetical protein n=1 Tax=Streptomyces rectiverticillatus TaxID=173860 RepID=UPI0015C2D8C1|nr:hypothetical protein [Streptomyces rectiverticillatus]QLE70950.1 hypothetical protein FGW37_04420 [Streptomyces rectiverticillatus]